MDAFRLQMVYELSVGDLQPIGIDVLHVSFVIYPICLQPTHIVEKSSSISVMDNAMRLISNTPLYVHRIIMKKRNCLRQNTQFVQSKIKVRLFNLCCHVTLHLSHCRDQC